MGKEPVICHTVRCFLQHPAITKIVLVVHPEDHKICEKAIADFKEQFIIIEGGETRQISTLHGLHALKNLKPQYVHIHDGARPFIEKQLLERIHASINHREGILPVLAVSDTLKRVNSAHHVLEQFHALIFIVHKPPSVFPLTSS